MHDYIFHTDVVRLAFLAGVVASMYLYERSHLTTGSIVVPGYIAVFLAQPFVIAATFANALFAWWFVNRFLPRWFLLYGRTKFTVLALVSVSTQAAMLKLSPSTSYLWESDISLLVGVGYVVPALIAHDMARQGVKKTVRAVLLAGVVVAAPVGLLLLVAGNPPLRPTHFGVMAIEPNWVPLAVFLSAAAAWALFENHALRCGGFIGAGYTAMLSSNLIHIAFILLVGIAAFLVVTRLLMPRMILFGRRKFAAMLLVSGAIAWTLIGVGGEVFGIDLSAYTTLAPIALTPLFVPGLVANDMHRSGLRNVLSGLALGGAWVLATTRTVQSIMGPRPVETFTLFVALLTGLYIFWDNLMSLAGRAFGWLGRTVRVPEVAVPFGAAVRGYGPTGRVVVRNATFTAGLGIAIGALVLTTIGRDATVASQVGPMLGRVALVVSAPLVVRYFWARILQADPDVRVRSGWLFVQAAIVAVALM